MSVTLKHVANRAGLSWQTVSKVLNDKGHLFRPETRQRVIDAAREMGYVPNAAARTMRSKKTLQIGLLLRNEEGHRYHNLAAFILLLGINTRLEQNGYLLSVVRMGDLACTGDAKSRVFEERVLDGLIVFGGFSPDVFDWVHSVIPNCIWADTNKWDEYCCLHRDEQQVGRLIAKHILDLGYRRAVWTGGRVDKHSHYSQADRYFGLKDELARHGIELESISSLKRDDNRLIYPELAQHFQPDRVLVAYNTLGAQAILTTGTSMGKSVGWDYGLMCCDETPEVFESWPGLSRVSNDRFEMGYQAAEMMLQLLDNPAQRPVSRKMGNEWIIGNTAWGPHTAR